MGEDRFNSEAAEMEAFLAELAGGAVREIAGMRSGFVALDAALNGIAPGLYLVVGPPAAGKSAFAKQLLDQAAQLNAIDALFFTFAEKKIDLRVRTLARLSGLETREIRRGSGYLLHTYGVAKQHVSEDDMAPGWEKLKAAAAQAKGWLERIYLFECDRKTTLEDVETTVAALLEASQRRVLAVIDDAQRLRAV